MAEGCIGAAGSYASYVRAGLRMDEETSLRGSKAGALSSAGRTAEAQAILEDLLQARKQPYLSPFWIGLVYVGLGEMDRALEWLETGYEERAAYIQLLPAHPLFDTLRGDPRFQDLVRRIDVPE